MACSTGFPEALVIGVRPAIRGSHPEGRCTGCSRPADTVRPVRRPVEPVCPSASEVHAWAAEVGLDALGVAPAAPLDRALAAIRSRIADGLDGGLPFTFKNPVRSTDPGRAVAEAAAVIVGARRYQLPAPTNAGPGRAEVARYAWADHYGALRESLWEIAGRLRRAGWKAVAFADDNSIVDREVAWLAGIGWFGKNANLLLPGAGSWFVLGCVVTNAPIEPASAPVADGCGGCRRCLDGCPTGAIVAPGVVDANRCLAWLLQRPGLFPAEYRVALGRRIYGCDDCQEVCPPNQRFGRDGAAIGPVVAAVAVGELLTAGDAELLERHGRWYLHDRETRWIRRNALVILGNIGLELDPGELERLLRRYLGAADPMLRAHAVWAARRCGRDDLLPIDDPDPDVAAELAAAVTPLAAGAGR